MDGNILAHNIDSKERTIDVTVQNNLSFQSLFLPKNIFDGLNASGFQKPSPIQMKAIPLGRCGFDLIVKSKSGTGKTIVFTVTGLEMVDPSIPELQVIIVAPTREVAVQIASVISGVGKSVSGLKVETFIGGFPEKDDLEKANKCHIAVGAPGRLKSLIKQKILKVKSVKLFILDEADKLMEKSFQNDINEIYYSLPTRKQIIATSATFPDNLKEFLSNYMHSPTEVTAELETPLLLGVKHFIKEVKTSSNVNQEMKNKNEVLLDLLSSTSFTQCLIFSNYQTRAETISLMLNNKGWNSSFISAAQSQTKRLEVIKNLKTFNCRILLSTDLTARGIDAANVDLVINYEVPVDVMTYLHRMGRAGRYGSKGICISLISGKKDLEKLQKFLGQIGGTNLSIPKLCNIGGKDVDLWNADLKNLEQVHGIIEDENQNTPETLKKEIMSMKNESKVKSGKSDENKKVDNALKNLSSLDLNKETENPSSEKVVEILDSVDEDPQNVLELLAGGNFDFESVDDVKVSKLPLSMSVFNSADDKKRKRDKESAVDDTKVLLESLAKGEFDFSNISETDSSATVNKCIMENSEESKKRKTLTAEENDVNKVFIKNKALFEVAKILTFKENPVDEETKCNLDKYLNSLKKDPVPSPSEMKNNESEIPQRGKNLDDIFIHAYRYIMDEKHHWKDFVPEDDLDEFSRKVTAEESASEVDEVEEVYNEDFEDDEEEEFVECPGIKLDENGKRIYSYEHIPNRMVWMPVEESVLDKKPDSTGVNLLEPDDDEHGYSNIEEMPELSFPSSDIQNRCEIIGGRNNTFNFVENRNSIPLDNYELRQFNQEHFTDCFERCSEELWHNGLSFNSVRDFDIWFHEWQQKVIRVSDYVRQNLYVREMSDHQNNYR